MARSFTDLKDQGSPTPAVSSFSPKTAVSGASPTYPGAPPVPDGGLLITQNGKVVYRSERPRFAYPSGVLVQSQNGRLWSLPHVSRCSSRSRWWSADYSEWQGRLQI